MSAMSTLLQLVCSPCTADTGVLVDGLSHI